MKRRICHRARGETHALNELLGQIKPKSDQKECAKEVPWRAINEEGKGKRDQKEVKMCSQCGPDL